MNGEPVVSVRNVTLDDVALEVEVLDDDDEGVTVDGILVEEILFRVLLLCFGTSDNSSELCGALISWQQTGRGTDYPPPHWNGRHCRSLQGDHGTTHARGCYRGVDPHPDQNV